MSPAGTAWRKSRDCASSTCVEVARDGDDYLMRDSKHPDQVALRFTRQQWTDFLGGIRAGDYTAM